MIEDATEEERERAEHFMSVLVQTLNAGLDKLPLHDVLNAHAWTLAQLCADNGVSKQEMIQVLRDTFDRYRKQQKREQRRTH